MTISSTTRLYMPCPFQLMQLYLFGYLIGCNLSNIHLISKYKNWAYWHIFMIYYTFKYPFSFRNSFNISWIDDIDDCIRSNEIVVPKFYDFTLWSNIPNCELKFFIFNLFDIESYSWNRCNGLFEFHLIEDCSLTCRIKA